jgi:hypothetical protein
MYDLTPKDKKFIVFDPAEKQIRVFTTNMADEGVYSLSLLVTPQTSGMSKTIDFTISVVKRCLTTVIKSLKPIPNISTLVSA